MENLRDNRPVEGRFHGPVPAAQREPTLCRVLPIPDYELVRPIGRGSCGEVWMARSTTGSLHAIKIIHRDGFDADKPYEREFNGIKEFEPISRAHPAQVDILHVGRNDDDGYFYYVMELADDLWVEPLEPTNTGKLRAEQRSSQQRHASAGSTGTASRTRAIDPETYAPKTLRTELSRRGRLPVSECLQIAVLLTEALEHLHPHRLEAVSKFIGRGIAA